MPHHLAHLFFGQKISNFFISPTKVRHRKNALLLKWAIRTLKRPYWQFLRLDPETLSRSLHQTTEKTPRVLNSANHRTNRWLFWNHRDSGWRSRTKLHQKHLFRDSEHTYNRCFWHVFGSMGFLQLEDRNSRTEHHQFQSQSLEIFRRFKGIRIGNSLNRDYTFSFSMKLSPQLLVYDQDANRSRRFNTNVGGLLEFHC